MPAPQGTEGSLDLRLPMGVGAMEALPQPHFTIALRHTAFEGQSNLEIVQGPRLTYPNFICRLVGKGDPLLKQLLVHI